MDVRLYARNAQQFAICVYQNSLKCWTQKRISRIVRL